MLKKENITQILIFSLALLLFLFSIVYNNIFQFKNGFLAKKISLELFSSNEDQFFDFYKISPNGNEEEIALYYDEKNKKYITEIENKYIKNLIFTLYKKDFDKIDKISIKIGDKEFDFDKEQIKTQWLSSEKKYLLYISNPKEVYYSRSTLSKFTSKFDVINWPGDLKMVKFIFLKNIPALILIIFLIVLTIIITTNYKYLLEMRKRLEILTKYKYFLYLLFFVVVSVSLRYPSFDKVIHVDEPTYLVVADRMVKGDLLYKDVVDNKAPILFFYYYIAMLLFNNLVLIRLFGAVFIGLTAFIIYLILQKIINQYIESSFNKKYQVIPFLGAMTYIVVSSFHSWNFWINPEQLVIFFNSLALLFLLSNKRYSVFLASVMLGLTFLTKYPAGLDYVAFAAIWLIIKHKEREKIGYYIKNIIFSVVGFIIPSLFVVVLFAYQANLREFFDVFYAVTFKYPTKKSFNLVFKTFLLFPKEIGLPFLFFVAGLIYISIKKELRFLLLLVSIWGLSTILCIFSPGKDFAYYWFQLWGVLALVIPFIFILLNDLFLKISKEPKIVIGLNTLLLLLLFFVVINKINLNFSEKEYIFEVKNFLKDKVKDDRSFVASEDGSHILYWLLNLKPPSKNIHKTGDMPVFVRWKRGFYMPKFVVNPSSEFYITFNMKKNYRLIYLKNKYRVYQIK